MHLLPRAALVKTGEVDLADWNYRLHLRAIQRMRFRLIVSLLGRQHYPRLLELGYGSGIFLPELARRCRDLVGVDPHQRAGLVRRALEGHGVHATLVTGGAQALPFRDHSFDAIVAVSTLEFVDDLDAALREISRVLVPGGILVAVTPQTGPVLDLGLRVLTGRNARRDFQSRRESVVPSLLRRLTLEKMRKAPRWAGPALSLYTGIRLRADAPGT